MSTEVESGRGRPNEDDDLDSEMYGSQVPRYLVKPSPLDQFTLDMKNILANMEEDGDCGDSDVGGDVAEDLDKVVKEAMKEKTEFEEEENTNLLIDDNID